MSDNLRIETNITDVFEDFSKYTAAELKKAIKSALNKATKTLWRKTKDAAAVAWPNTQNVSKKHNAKLIDAVRAQWVKESSSHVFYSKVRIHYMMKGEKVNKYVYHAYVLPMLERGTKPGYHQKQGITGKSFFETTKKMFMSSEKDAIFNEQLNKMIIKINAKNFK